MLTPAQLQVLTACFNALSDRPRPLVPLLGVLAGEGQAPDQFDLAAHVQAAEQSDQVLNRLRYLLVGWDASDGEWATGSGRNTPQRRERIYDMLGLDRPLRAALDERLPFAPSEPAVLISDVFERWYSNDIRQKQDFYWRHYKNYLLTMRGLQADVIQSLDENTTFVLERMADPRRREAYQAKGLVVGYVQSGKTANFTGVIAKAIDTGYRLIVVLSGLTNLLRNQTQRRIDMELVGKEQIRPSGEVDPSFDYATDPSWDRFITYGGLPVDLGGAGIVRLTGAGSGGEFRSLQHGIRSLEIEKRDRRLPLYDPVNLPFAGARLLVIKKHPRIIGKLIRDMKRVGLPLFADVPALLIDDESDQASVNTIDPSKSGDKLRTSTNARIRELLSVLPRAQYVGYTATPFANVFVSLQDAEDLFPKDYILSLPRPKDYIGVSFFHDIDRSFDDGEQDVANSRERAFVRDVPSPQASADDRMIEALDAFVLSGALKLFRARHGVPVDTTHHTMLIHSSSRQADQSNTAKQVRSLWRHAGYDGGAGIARLRVLFESDFLPVSRSRGEGLPIPDSLDQLVGDLAEAIHYIDVQDGPVYIVNGSDESDDPDFDLRPVWKVLVGGAKLSRGYTVEGLTISYFRRRSTVQDTLLQMGRWFGFRRGYQDLLRLYLGRRESLDKTGKVTLDLYRAFEAVCRDEDAFRTQLAQYALPPDGSKPITPKEVPPIVFNSHPQLRPTSKNRMFNAELVVVNFGGKWIERTGLAERDLDHNAKLFEQLIKTHTPKRGTFTTKVEGVGKAAADFLWLVAPHEEILHALRSMRWTTSNVLRLELHYLSGQAGDPAVDDWAVIMPQISKSKTPWEVGGERFACVERTRVGTSTGGRFLAFSDPGHRLIAETIARLHKRAEPNEAAAGIRQGRRGVLLLYPTKERGRADQPTTPFMGVAVLPPASSASITTQFMVRKPSSPDAVVVTIPSRARTAKRR